MAKVLELTENGLCEVDVESGGGETVNIETLSADKTLTASDATVQIYTSTSNRVINLPTTGLAIGQKFVFINNNAYNNVAHYEIKQGVTTLNKLYSESICTMYWDGTNWDYSQRNNVGIGYNANAYSNGIALGYETNGYSNGVAIGYNANAYSKGVAIGYYANGSSTGTAIGCYADGSAYGAAAGYYANGSSYGAAVGRDANTNSKSYNTTVYGAYSKAERNREFISTATQGTANKAQLTFQKYKEKDLTSSGAAWQELFIDASSARLTIIAKSVYHFLIQINAIDTTTFDVKTWELKGAIKRNGSNTTSIVGTVTKTVTSADTGTDNWDVQVTADDTNEALKIEVKHDSSNSVRYSLNTFSTETRI